MKTRRWITSGILAAAAVVTLVVGSGVPANADTATPIPSPTNAVAQHHSAAQLAQMKQWLITPPPPGTPLTTKGTAGASTKASAGATVRPDYTSYGTYIWDSATTDTDGNVSLQANASGLPSPGNNHYRFEGSIYINEKFSTDVGPVNIQNSSYGYLPGYYACFPIGTVVEYVVVLMDPNTYDWIDSADSVIDAGYPD